MAAQVTLNKEQIRELLLAFRECYLNHIEFQKKYLTAIYIQFPKIPPILSESIIKDLLEHKEILSNLQLSGIRRNGRISDISALNRSKELKIEVKATGNNGFQNFGTKDINADYLIWIHFDRFFKDEKISCATLYILKKPIRFFKKSDKINLAAFLKAKPEKYILDCKNFYLK